MFLVEQAGLDRHAAYSTFNMGSGYAIYCSEGAGAEVVEMARTMGFQAVIAGSVESGQRQVIVEPIGVHYIGDELDLSAAAQPPS